VPSNDPGMWTSVKSMRTSRRASSTSRAVSALFASVKEKPASSSASAALKRSRGSSSTTKMRGFALVITLNSSGDPMFLECYDCQSGGSQTKMEPDIHAERNWSVPSETITSRWHTHRVWGDRKAGQAQFVDVTHPILVGWEERYRGVRRLVEAALGRLQSRGRRA